MRRGFTTLAALTEQTPKQDPFAGHLFVCHGRRGDLIKNILRDGRGDPLIGKRLGKGRFVWSSAKAGKIALTAAQLAMHLAGIDGRFTEQDSAWNGRKVWAGTLHFAEISAVF
jgi:transposase